MKMLLIGDPNSIWLLNFIEYYLISHDIKVTIFTDIKLKQRNINFYKEREIEVIECLHRGIFVERKPTKLGFWMNLLKGTIQQKSFEEYDIINIQYVDLTLLIWIMLITRFPEKIILSYWGSDLFRKKKYVLKVVAPFVRRAGKYTFDNIDLYNFFIDIYGWKLKERSFIALFGISILENIKKCMEIYGRDEIRQKYSIAQTDIVIAIGYNGKHEQQHIKVLQEIKKLSEQLKQRIIILLQMTYGGDECYRNAVKSAANKISSNIYVYENFLDDCEVAELRCITDIYINSQITDAFSGSVCEYLYGGAHLVNARWLRYAEFDKYPFKFWEFDTFSLIPDIIQKIIKNSRREDNEINRQLTWQLRSWECCQKSWSTVLVTENKG